MERTERIIPSLGTPRRGPGRPPVLTHAELVCLAVAPVLRCGDERHWLRGARPGGPLFPRLLGQSGYNARLKDAGLMEAVPRWLAQCTPSSAKLLRLMDGTRCAAGRRRSARAWP